MISVVIRNKNQEESLSFLLKNLNERYINDIGEIIVVDNLSTDDSKKVCEKYNARFISINDFGYGRSANLATSNVKFDYVVIFSAHSYPVSHDFFKLIIEKFKSNKKLAGLRCLHNSNDFKNFIDGVSFKSDPDKSGLIFCGSAYSKKVWEEHKFNEQIATFEDKEWSKRVVSFGYEIEFCPSIFCYDIKRTRKQLLFRFKNDLKGNYQLWGQFPTILNCFNFLIFSHLRVIRDLFLSINTLYLKLFYMLKFIFIYNKKQNNLDKN